MIDINLKQYKMLSKINNNKTIKCDNLNDDEKKICEFLSSKGFISSNCCFVTKNTPLGKMGFTDIENYEITEEGKAQISAYISSFHKWWIPLIVSIASFILSCVSLLKQ